MSGKVIPPEVRLLLIVVFTILRFLPFHTNLRIDLSMSLKNCVRIFGDFTEFIDCLWYDGHLYYVNSANP